VTGVLFAAPVQSRLLFVTGVGFIGYGSGLFAHSTLTAAMRLAPVGQIGLAIGAWGAVQATASGFAIATAGILRDWINAIATAGRMGDALNSPATGYGVVYTVEILLLFATLVAIGPLVSRIRLEKKPLVRDPRATELLFRSLSHY
jgi:BCD family chlorophyll transporter-like MFS transporter